MFYNPPYFSTSGYDVLELPLTTQPGISYAYDILGNLLSVTDAKGNVTAMMYDAPDGCQERSVCLHA